MALIGNDADTLLHGLSDFWLRYFKDIGDIQGIYEGTEILLGQHYLNLLNDVLNIAVTETPLFRKEYYKLYTIRQDQLVYYATDIPLQNRYVYYPTEPINRVPQLQNKVFSATAALEQGVDYEIIDGNIGFVANPFDAEETQAFARRQLTVAVSGFVVSPGLDDAQPGDELELYLSQPGAPYTTLKVVHVAPGRVAISRDTPLPTVPPQAANMAEAYTWKLMRRYSKGERKLVAERNTYDGTLDRTTTLEVYELAFWAVDVEVDDGRLFETFGYLFGDKQRSTEAYRAFIRGLMQLYTFGPAIERVESALNVVANLEVARDDSETVLGYDSGLINIASGSSLESSDADTTILYSAATTFLPNYVGGLLSIKNATLAANLGTFTVTEYIDPQRIRIHRTTGSFADDVGYIAWEFSYDGLQRVITSARTYAYPRAIPVRDDVKDPANFDKLTLRAFEPLTTAVQVTDYLEDPEWWHHITIPQELLPEQEYPRRIVSPTLYPNQMGPGGDFNIGDPGLYIGADEDGFVTEYPVRHRASFILLDRVLKMHLFMVNIDPSIDMTGVIINDLQQLVREVKPAHTMVYFRPFTQFEENISLVDVLSNTARRTLQDPLFLCDNHFCIGNDVFIGGEMGYAEAHGGALVSPGIGVNLVIGGLNPYIEEASSAVLEHVLSVTPRAAA